MHTDNTICKLWWFKSVIDITTTHVVLRNHFFNIFLEIRKQMYVFSWGNISLWVFLKPKSSYCVIMYRLFNHSINFLWLCCKFDSGLFISNVNRCIVYLTTITITKNIISHTYSITILPWHIVILYVCDNKFCCNAETMILEVSWNLKKLWI